MDLEIFELQRLRDRLGESFTRAVELIKAAVEAELTRLLTANGLANSLMAVGAMPSAPVPGIQLAKDSNPARLGQQIGRAIYGGIGK